ncbi:MAG: hypothetical protein HN337_08580 [Deltaproteobacteria bacterium]|jgi:hypothetical protein|nr:hypothetical protein [Deltaproteobacteria bacterium]
MRGLIKISLLIAVAVLLIGCSKSPSDGTNYSDGGPEVAPDSSPAIKDRLALEAGLKKIVYHVGPVDIPRGLKSEDMLEKPLIMTFQTDEPVWLVGFSPRVVDANGSKLPSELLHSAIMSNLHEENPLCSDAGGGNPFAAATSMLTEIELPQGYGYPILSTDPLEARVVLQNGSSESYVDVYFELTMLVKPMSEMTKLKDVKPMLIEIDPCTHEAADVAPGKFVEFNATYEVPDDANLIVAHGLLESYGSTVELVARDEATPFWSADANLDEEHRIVSLEGDPFEDSQGVFFKEGDAITMDISYDNSSDEWLDGVTAAAMVYLAVQE